MITSSVVMPVHQMCQARLPCPVMNDADQTLAWARQRPGGKGEEMRTAQAGSSRVDKIDHTIYLRNFTTQDSKRSLYRDLKEDVAGTHGRRLSETVMKRHRQIVIVKITLLSRSLSLDLQTLRPWPMCKEMDGQEGKTKTDSLSLQGNVTDCETMSEIVSSRIYERDSHLCEEILADAWITAFKVLCSLFW